ncbi:oligosaccharide flippase family protein [Lentisphaerota bacterium ZTH]|nr:oligosaccharide flippase family protein [Lentisphaerota bacterium]WET05489.1 oligosaccharide flippase family protein [Lentisphaerota bacterium ZTH]
MTKRPLLTFIKGSLISLIAMLLTGLVTYLRRRYLALHLTKEEFGFFYAAFAFVSLLAAVLDFGIAGASPVVISRHAVLKSEKEKKANFTAILLLKMFFGVWGLLFIPFAGWLVSWYFHFPVGKDVLVILLIFSLIYNFTEEVMMIAVGFKDYLGKAIMEVAYYTAILVVILIVLENYGIKGAAWAYFGSALVVMVLGIIYLTVKYRIRLTFNFKLVWKKIVYLAHFGKWLAIASLASTSMGYIDTVMLTYIKGLEATAIYNIALPLVQIMKSMLFLPLVFVPIATELWHKKQTGSISDICNAMLMLILAGFWGMIMFLSLFGRDLIILLFSDRFVAASDSLTILGSGILFLIIAQFFIGTIAAMEKLRAVAYTGLAGVLCNIVFNALLIPFIGIEGAALATSFSYLAIFIISYLILRRHVENLRLLYPWTLNITGIVLAGGALYFSHLHFSLLYRMLFFAGLLLLFCIANFRAICFMLQHLLKQMLAEL